MAAPMFDITKLLKLVEKGKYEITNTGFAVIDKLDRIDIPKKLRERKIAVQVLTILSDELVKYAYVEKKQLSEEEKEQDMLGKMRNTSNERF